MKPNFQQQMNSLLSEYQEQFTKEQQDYWNATAFVSDAIDDNFRTWRYFAFAFESPVKMNISPDYFKKLWLSAEIEDLTLADAITICRAMENRVPYDYLCSKTDKTAAAIDYCKFLDCMEALTQQVNAIVEPEKDRLIRKMQTLQQLQLKSGRKQLT